MDLADTKWATLLEETIPHMLESHVEKVVMVAFDGNGNAYISSTENSDIMDYMSASFWLDHEAHIMANESEAMQEEGE